MSLVMGSGSNLLAADKPERTQAGKHTDQPEPRETVPGGRAQQWGYPELITEERKVHLLSSINSASPLVAMEEMRSSVFSIQRSNTASIEISASRTGPKLSGIRSLSPS
jgi:hypothetical protein